MSKKKRAIFFFSLAFILIVLIKNFSFTFFSHYNKWTVQYAQKKGNEIVEKIEKYKIIENRLPESVSDIGLKPDDYWKGAATNYYGTKYFYEKLSDDEFEIYFSISVGDALYYNSSRGEWSINP
ncbi:MAG: hypothetical protein K6B17_04875 [Treponema sp.]|nr:hypothetical protein [Treponema sp.]